MNVKQFYQNMCGVYMKRIVCLLGALVITPLSYAAAEPYAAVSGGLSLVNTSNVTNGGTVYGYHYTGGPEVSVAGGYRIDRHRFELEYSYKKTPVNTISKPVTITLPTIPPTTGTITVTNAENDADLTVSSYMANYYLNIYETRVTPFVGAGIGILSGELSSPASNANGITLGMQFSAGATYHLNNRFDLDLMYRYQFANSSIKGNATAVSYGSSNFSGGVRCYF
jgi:opacity protein-like surface antigen